MIKQIKNWFATLSSSEQRLLGVGSVLISLALIWVIVYLPVTKHIEQQVNINARLQSQLSQMQEMTGDIGATELVSVQEIPINMTFSSWLDQQLQQAGLQQMVNRTEPIDEDKISIWFQGVSFNQVADWLEMIAKTYAVQVDQIDINVVDSSLGLTEIRMRLVK